MARFILTLCITIFLTQAFGQIKPKGSFVGLEEMKNFSDPAKPNYKWYHLSVINFKNDSVFLGQSPIAIYKKDTIFSVSDGGFYSYSGTLQKYKGKTIADLTLISCDYCPMQIIRFRPPKIINDNDTTVSTIVDTATHTEQPEKIENPRVKYKILLIDATNNSRMLLVDKNIYRRQKK